MKTIDCDHEVRIQRLLMNGAIKAPQRFPISVQHCVIITFSVFWRSYITTL